MNLIITSAEDLRQIIREELSKSAPVEAARPIEAPITTAQLCDFLNVTEPTIIRWRKKGKIPFLQLGSSIRYDKAAVLAALDGGKKRRIN
jgi:excisionase family DNA binding protein